MYKMEENFEVRDMRNGNWFRSENSLFDYLPEIGDLGFVLYCLLARYAGSGWQAYPSYNTLAKTVLVARRTVMKTIKKLVDVGLITVEKRLDKTNSRGHDTNIYTLLAIKPIGSKADKQKDQAIKNSKFANDPRITTPSDSTGISKFASDSTNTNLVILESKNSSFASDSTITQIRIREEENKKKEKKEEAAKASLCGSPSQETFVPSQEKSITTQTDLLEWENNFAIVQETTQPLKQTKPRQITTPKQAVNSKQSDPRANHPAILAVKEIIVSAESTQFPKKLTWDDIINLLGETPDKLKLQQCAKTWLVKGYNIGNLGWLFDWYVNGIPLKHHKQTHETTSTQTSTSWPTEEELAKMNTQKAQQYRRLKEQAGDPTNPRIPKGSLPGNH